MGEITQLHPGKPETAITPPAPLDSSHDITAFDCGKPPLTDWLRYKALRNEGRGGSRTYVVCEGRRVVGYYAVAAGAVEREWSPLNLSRNMPDPIPLFVIGRLAVDTRYQGQKIGSGLLKDALARCLNASKEIGARAVLVHAIDDDAVGFYLRYKFKQFPTEVRTLYLPISHIVAAL